MDGRWALIGHPNAQASPFVDGSIGYVHAFEDDPSSHNLVLGIAHDGHEERGLAGAVRSEQNMCLSRFDVEVDVPEYDFSCKLNLQIFYRLTCYCSCGESSPIVHWYCKSVHFIVAFSRPNTTNCSFALI